MPSSVPYMKGMSSSFSSYAGSIALTTSGNVRLKGQRSLRSRYPLPLDQAFPSLAWCVLVLLRLRNLKDSCRLVGHPPCSARDAWHGYTGAWHASWYQTFSMMPYDATLRFLLVL